VAWFESLIKDGAEIDAGVRIKTYDKRVPMPPAKVDTMILLGRARGLIPKHLNPYTK
jgi:hypothetical protein